MGRNTITTLFLFVGLLAGCGSNVEGKFIKALNSDDGKRLCVNQNDLGVMIVGKKNGVQYLINRGGMLSIPKNEVARMLAKFAEKGYVDRAPINIRFQYQRYGGYRLTDKGRKYFIWGQEVCIGDRTATSVIEYTEPSEMGGMTVTEVKFRYDLALNKFGSDLDLEKTPDARIDIDGKGKAIFVKTNKGWRIEKGWIDG